MSSLLRSSKLVTASTVRRATTRALVSSSSSFSSSSATKPNSFVVAPATANRFSCNYPSTSHFRGFRSSAVNMGVTIVKSAKEFKEVLSAHKVVIVDAFAEWCGPCKAISPTIEKHSETFTDAFFIKFDVDELPDLAQELGIRAMPTFVFFKDGEKVKEVIGANPNAIELAIKDAVA